MRHTSVFPLVGAELIEICSTLLPTSTDIVTVLKTKLLNKWTTNSGCDQSASQCVRAPEAWIMSVTDANANMIVKQWNSTDTWQKVSEIWWSVPSNSAGGSSDSFKMKHGKMYFYRSSNPDLQTDQNSNVFSRSIVLSLSTPCNPLQGNINCIFKTSSKHIACRQAHSHDRASLHTLKTHIRAT